MTTDISLQERFLKTIFSLRERQANNKRSSTVQKKNKDQTRQASSGKQVQGLKRKVKW